MEMLPFLGATDGPSGIVLSQDELHRKTLELLQLLPPNLLGLQVGAGGAGWRCHRVEVARHRRLRGCGASGCRPAPFLLSPSPASPSTARAGTSWTSSSCAGCWRPKRWVGAPRPGTPSPRWGWGAQPLLHPPVLAGKATRERGPWGVTGRRWGGVGLSPQPESERWVCDVAPRPFCKGAPWAGMDFTDSDSDGEDEVPKRCFKVLGVSPDAPQLPSWQGEGGLAKLRLPLPAAQRAPGLARLPPLPLPAPEPHAEDLRQSRGFSGPTQLAPAR